MIYTGNNGRIYIARSRTNQLTGSFNVVLTQAVSKNQTFFVRPITGKGAGATVQAQATGSIGQSIQFLVVAGGIDYSTNNIVRFCRNDNGGTTIDITGDITLAAASIVTTGVANERQILDDQYRIAKIRSWSLTSNSEVVETTALGDVVKTFSPSITSGDGSATLMFYEDDLTNAGSSRQKDIFELIDILFPRNTPPRVILNLAIDGSTNGNTADLGGGALWKTNFLFNAYITSASVAASYGEVVTVDTSFTVDGPLLDVPWKPNVIRL